MSIIHNIQYTSLCGKYTDLTMKFIQAASLLTTISIASNGVTAFAAVAEKSCAAGGAGVHVPIGKDGEGEYTASTKGWCVECACFMSLMYPYLTVSFGESLFISFAVSMSSIQLRH